MHRNAGSLWSRRFNSLAGLQPSILSGSLNSLMQLLRIFPLLWRVPGTPGGSLLLELPSLTKRGSSPQGSDPQIQESRT